MTWVCLKIPKCVKTSAECRVKDETNHPLIIEASKAKGFLDYKDLLETHYVHREEENVNVFRLLVESLLANTINRLTGEKSWQ